MKHWTWILLAAFLVAPRTGTAVSGQVLLDWCEAHLAEVDADAALSPVRSSVGAACLGYVSAVIDTIRTAKEWKQWRLDVCVDDDVPTVEVARAYVAWARENPSRLDRLAANGLARALNRAYRCG